MATALSSISLSPNRNLLSCSNSPNYLPPFWVRKLCLRHAVTSIQKQSLSAKSCRCTASGASVSDELSISVNVIQSFIELNLGKWIGAFHQFDCNGNLLNKIDTKLAVSSYGDGELSSLIQSLYIKQPPLNTSDSESESEWFEYKIKETNIFTVDKYQQIGFFSEEKAFALRYQTAGMLETVLRQGVLGENDIREECPRNLKLPSCRPAIVCENCLFSLNKDARVRAFHIMDPKGILDMLIVFLEERCGKVLAHPSLVDSKDRIISHLGTWKGHSVTKRSGVYGFTMAEADTTATLEMNEDGQLIQDIKSKSGHNDATCTVNWKGSISNNLVTFDGGYQVTFLHGGIYMGFPSDVSKSVQESKSFHLELCWLESLETRQRLIRTYDMEGLAVSSTYILETRQ